MTIRPLRLQTAQYLDLLEVVKKVGILKHLATYFKIKISKTESPSPPRIKLSLMGLRF